MISRRNMLGATGALGATALVGGGSAAVAQNSEIGLTPAPPASQLTPDQALALLREGNAAFLNGIAWNGLNAAIVIFLLYRSRRGRLSPRAGVAQVPGN